MKKLFTFLTVAFFLNSIVAIPVTWIGGAGNWSNGANWDNGVGVGPGDDAIIPATGNVAIPNGVFAVAKSVDVQAGARLRVNIWATLEIDGATDVSGLTVNGTSIIYGTLNVLNTSNPSNNLNAGNGIFCNGKIYVYPQAQISIHTTSEDGIAIGNSGKMYHYGTTIIENTDNNGIGNLKLFYNYGDIDILMNNVNPIAKAIFNGKNFRNYATGNIYTYQGEYGFANTLATSVLKNYGNLTLTHGNHSGLYNGSQVINYNNASIIGSYAGFAGIFNTGNISNSASINAHSSDSGIYNFGSIVNNSKITSYLNTGNSYVGQAGSNFENNDYFTCRQGIYMDGATLHNSSSGKLIFDGRLYLNNSSLINDWYMQCIYSGAQIFTGVNTFDNNGFLDDRFDKLSADVTNNQARSHKQTGTLQNGIAFSNILDIGVLSNVNIPTSWYDASNGGNLVGTYDPATNEFTPNALAVGLNSLFFTVTNSIDPYVTSVEVILDNPVIAMVNPISNNTINTNESVDLQLPYSPINITPYPNPTTSEFTIESELPENLAGENIQLYILDQYGNTVHQKNLGADHLQLFSNIKIPQFINTGLFYIQIRTNKNIIGNGKLQVVK